MSVDQKIILKRMDEALALAASIGLDQASVGCTIENGFAATVRQGEVESVEHHKQVGFVLSVARQGLFQAFDYYKK